MGSAAWLAAMPSRTAPAAHSAEYPGATTPHGRSSGCCLPWAGRTRLGTAAGDAGTIS